MRDQRIEIREVEEDRLPVQGMGILPAGRTPGVDGGPVTEPVSDHRFGIVKVVVDVADAGRHLC